jgi:hypothetical protein
MTNPQTYAARIRAILHDAVDAQGTNGVRYIYGFSDAKSAAALIAAEADAEKAEAEKRIGETWKIMAAFHGGTISGAEAMEGLVDLYPYEAALASRPGKGEAETAGST